tara:strand:+ start:56 stop:952 length:897 start_codon:yes stop_codon:yes gene_type:complete
MIYSFENIFKKLIFPYKKYAKFLLKIIRFSYNLFFKIPFIEKPLPKVPFSSKPFASKSTYLNLHKKTIQKEYKGISLIENNLGFSIDKDWFSDLSLVTQTCIKESKLNFNHGRLLYSVLSNYLTKYKVSDDKPILILETGTARGFSAICMSKALNQQDVKGIIITIDCIPHNERIYWNSISDCDGKTTREELLSKWSNETRNILFIHGWSNKVLKRLHSQRVNFAFLDAQHTKKAVIEEFKFVSSRQIKGDIIIFDDVTPGIFDGVCEAVKEIKRSSDYSIEYLNFDNLRGYAIATKN